MLKDFLGYAHHDYAISLKEFGEPRKLPNCGGWILVRAISGTPYKDAMGCYPLFSCRNWERLHEDLEQVGPDLVSLSLVTDPLSGVDPAYLNRCFDFVKPFKTHYIIDLIRPLESFIGKVHRKNARKTLELMDVEICMEPAEYLDEWIKLYENLISKHNMKGINAFSPECFKIQLAMPGMVMFLARREREIIGATLVLKQEKAAYFHLSAFTSEGYKIRASYGTHWAALVYGLEKGIRYFNLGGTAGIKEDPKDGLGEFKRGWSNEYRTAYFCGRIFDHDKFKLLCQLYTISDVEYFPPYRSAERAKSGVYAF